MITGWIEDGAVRGLRKMIVGVVCENKCKGRGALFINNEFIDCECMKEFSMKARYVAAGIPARYWSFNPYDEFRKGNKTALVVIENYIKNIKAMVEDGVGLFLHGKYGLGKSGLGYNIIKAGLENSIVSYAIRMSSITDLIRRSTANNVLDEKFEWIKNNVELLMIDEFDKDSKVQDTSTYTGTYFNEFINDFYDKNASLIITSNLDLDELRKVHSISVIDRLTELSNVKLKGDSFRSSDVSDNAVVSGKRKGKSGARKT